MSESEVGSITLLLLLFVAMAHLLGYFFAKLRQPRVIGEILAGVLLGPTLLGRLWPEEVARIGQGSIASVLNFVYWLGLLLLMFLSGAETRHLFRREDRRQISWLAAFGTGLPFLLVLLAGRWLPLEAFTGNAHNRLSVLLVMGIAVAVTSIPVISRIFYDLKILHTRFASLVLGVAVIEDVVLWGVLAVAIALASSAGLPQIKIAQHLAATLLYFGVALTLAPKMVRRLSTARWNFLGAHSPVGYVIAVLFGYTALAAALRVSLVFAAFLAGYGLTVDDNSSVSHLLAAQRVGHPLDAVSKFSFAMFIPVYFAVVGYRLDLSKTLSLAMVAGFVAAACLVKLACVGLGARLAGFPARDAVNLAVATNARGGPGIVLASVAFDAAIINAPAFTTLIVLAVVTSQAAGAWLEHVVRQGKSLLEGESAAAEASGRWPVASER